MSREVSGRRRMMGGPKKTDTYSIGIVSAKRPIEELLAATNSELNL